MLSGVVAQAQKNFKIQPLKLQKDLVADTATVVHFRCVWLDIQAETSEQKPVFYLELVSEDNRIISGRNVTYDDMVKACLKNNIPESQHSAIIQQVYSAVLCGTKTQKFSAIRTMLAGYGIVLKPDTEQ